MTEVQKSQVKVVYCSVLHVQTRRRTTPVAFRQRTASPGGTIYRHVLCEVSFSEPRGIKNLTQSELWFSIEPASQATMVSMIKDEHWGLGLGGCRPPRLHKAR